MLHISGQTSIVLTVHIALLATGERSDFIFPVPPERFPGRAMPPPPLPLETFKGGNIRHVRHILDPRFMI